MSAEMELSEEVFYDRFEAMLDAFQKGDCARADEIARGIPLPPAVAMQRKHYMSKTDILAFGFDMSLVEAECGEDWYEKP